MKLKKCLLTNDDCYKKQLRPRTGANNPNLKRYVQPDDGYSVYIK